MPIDPELPGKLLDSTGKGLGTLGKVVKGLEKPMKLLFYFAAFALIVGLFYRWVIKEDPPKTVTNTTSTINNFHSENQPAQGMNNAAASGLHPDAGDLAKSPRDSPGPIAYKKGRHRAPNAGKAEDTMPVSIAYAPLGIAISGGNVDHPTVNNYAQPAREMLPQQRSLLVTCLSHVHGTYSIGALMNNGEAYDYAKSL